MRDQQTAKKVSESDADYAVDEIVGALEKTASTIRVRPKSGHR